jgi:uncharacterized protein (DUF2267 family)
MDEDQLVSRVQGLGGFQGRADAMRAIRATLLALGERLRDEERRRLARDVPAAAQSVLDRAAYAGDFDVDDLYVRVARHERVDPGFAVEHAGLVCQVLGELLPDEAMIRLRKELGGSIAALFEGRPPIETVPRSRTTAGSTLASGRDGSRHPISEARSDGAQSGSVAREGNPHGATKLSSARGLTQERAEETLAAGHAGPRRPIAETKD